MTVWHQTIFKVILQLSECSVPFPRFNVYFSNERGFSLLVPMIKAGAGLGIDSHIADVHLANGITKWGPSGIVPLEDGLSQSCL